MPGITKNLYKVSLVASISFLIGACQTMQQEQGAEAFEKIPPGESAQIARIAGQTIELQDKRKDLPEQMGKLLRGVHPKSHGCVDAEFIINADLPEKYRVGLFAKPGKKYYSQIRFSNASVKIAHDLEDEKNGSRGMAIKVYDVEGEFLEKDNGRQHQDFLMINTPEFAFADVRGYAFLTDALQASEHGNSPDSLLGLVVILATINKTPPPFPQPEQQDMEKLEGFLATQNSQLPPDFTLEDLKDLTTTMNIVVTKIQQRPVRNPLQVQYFGAAPFLFGEDRVMKFSAAPDPKTEQLKFDSLPNENYLGEALAESMQGKREIHFDFKIQVRDKDADFGDEQVLIERATTTWDTPQKTEVEAYENVAKIKILVQQKTDSERARIECEGLAFTPWHSLAVHQPVGGINRLRRSVYTNSAVHRGAGN